MADKKTCEMPRCGREFTPGKSGWGGHCRMHAERLKRGSPRAYDPEPVRGSGDNDVIVSVHMPARLKKHLAKAAGALGLSRYARGLLELHSGFKRSNS